MNLILRTAREYLRQLSYHAGLAPRARPNQTGSLADRFKGIYERGDWAVGGGDVPLSGTGSTLAATEQLRAELPVMLERLGATSLLDIGCGDFTWMRSLDLPCAYIGVDIVPEVVAANIAAFASDRRSFLVLDAVVDAVPRADTVLIREVLFHLSFADARALLRNVAASGCEWMMLTSDRGTGFNADIASGGARLLNLEIKPFRFGLPDHTIEEPGSYRGRRIGVWRAATIAKALGPAAK